MATVTDLPTLDSLRDEQRALRAQLARLRQRLHLELVLEFAAEAAVLLILTAAVLVVLDWWFRFSLPVRLVLITLSAAAVLAAARCRRGAAMAVGPDRRALAGGLARSLPARRRPEGCRRAPASGPAGRAQGVGLAGDGPAGCPASERRTLRLRLAVALEPAADVAAHGGLAG